VCSPDFRFCDVLRHVTNVVKVTWTNLYRFVLLLMNICEMCKDGLMLMCNGNYVKVEVISGRSICNLALIVLLAESHGKRKVERNWNFISEVCHFLVGKFSSDFTPVYCFYVIHLSRNDQSNLTLKWLKNSSCMIVLFCLKKHNSISGLPFNFSSSNHLIFSQPSDKIQQWSTMAKHSVYINHSFQHFQSKKIVEKNSWTEVSSFS
jgi:hypothetical protein